MLWFLAVAGVCAAAVTAYNQLRRRDPDAATDLIDTIREATTIVVIITQALTTTLNTLHRPTRRYAPVTDPGELAWNEFG